MTRERTRRRLLLLGLGAALVASAAAGLLAAPAMAAPLASDAPDVVAADSIAQQQEDLEVTATYYLAPEHEHAVNVTVTIHNPETRDSLRFWNGTSRRHAVEGDGFSEGSDGEYWYADDTATEPSITFRYEPGTFDRAYEYYNDTSAIVEQSYLPIQENGSSVHSDEMAADHVPAQGTTVRDYVCIGPCERETVTVGNRTITVLGNAQMMADPPETISQVLEGVASVQESRRSLDHDVLSVAVPTVGGNAAGRAGGNKHRVAWSYDAYGTSVWAHEYVHNTEGVATATDMSWFTEGYAEYGQYLYTTQAGYAGFDEFRSDLESGIEDPVSNLSDPNTWSSDIGGNNYHQGARALMAIDRQIRMTPGNDTFEDVVAEMHEDDFDGTVDGFAEEVGNVSNETVENRTRTWLTSDDEADLPDTWGYDHHVEVFGGVPRFNASNATVEIQQPVERANPFDRAVVTTDGQVVVEQTVENNGSAEGHYRVLEARANSGQYTDLDQGIVTLAPQEERTVTASVAFDEPGYHTFSATGIAVDVAVFDPDARILNMNESHTAGDEPVPVAPDAPTLAVRTDSNLDIVEVTAPDGEVVHTADIADLEGSTTRVDVDDLEPGTTYEVTSQSVLGDHTKNVTVLEPVDGVVPQDVNRDGLHRDFNADGAVTQGDVSQFFDVQHRSSVQDYPEAYDFSGNGEVGLEDVSALFAYA